ncbi:transglutaminase family protein [Pseudooctadecabacter sp.]|uniref:transglutaminase family protein n=1 Tax=Pseudooctadecabacter sp. TaxID=1966338 RepID=UPI0025EFFCB1|nr:transglutaminase family protein [Pseudooctadecabacter sp.]
MRIKVSHQTEYTYAEPVSGALQQVRLWPVDSPMQRVTDWAVTVDGGRVEAGYSDHHGNQVRLVCADEGVQALTISVEGEVETADTSGILGPVYGRAPLWYFQQPTALTTAGDGVTALADSVRNVTGDLDRYHALSGAILDKVAYVLNQTDMATTAEGAVSQGSGVCQDHANIFVAAARHLGAPARYVSGYLFMDDRIEQDASHAWAEVHLDGLGWVGFDVSNQISPDERYVRLAIGRDAKDAAPISGLRMGQGDENLVVSLQVQQ